MSLPGQMFDHALNPAKGWPSQNALDFTAKVSANVLYDLVAGRACHLNSSGQLEPGVFARQMGLFLFQGVNDLDVNNQRNDEWTPISPTGKIACLVAKGPYELETTEFDSAQTYAINDMLRAPSGNGTAASATGGVLTNQSVVCAADLTGNPTAVCGIVSRGVFTNNYRKSVLAFWPIYYPGKSSET